MRRLRAAPGDALRRSRVAGKPWKPWTKRLLTLALLFGALVGAGAFTFHYAAGFSYLSNDPAACANCHIMNEQFDAWRKGPHHAAATCNDCHVPPQFPAKYVAKALNGYHHSSGFTLQPSRPDAPGAKRVFEEPIRIKPRQQPDPPGQLPALPRRLRPRRGARQHLRRGRHPLRALPRRRRPRGEEIARRAMERSTRRCDRRLRPGGPGRRGRHRRGAGPAREHRPSASRRRRTPSCRLVEVDRERRRPGQVGDELAARVRRLPAHRRADPHQVRRRAGRPARARCPRRRPSATPGSRGSSPATSSRSTTATGAATPSCSSTRRSPSATCRRRRSSRATASTATPRSCRSTASSGRRPRRRRSEAEQIQAGLEGRRRDELLGRPQGARGPDAAARPTRSPASTATTRRRWSCA